MIRLQSLESIVDRRLDHLSGDWTGLGDPLGEHGALFACREVLLECPSDDLSGAVMVSHVKGSKTRVGVASHEVRGGVRVESLSTLFHVSDLP